MDALPDALRERQKGFSRTGGMHAAGIATAAGELLAVREDVGRLNAADNVIGWAAREGLLQLRGHVLVVSARASFELVQKAVMAGIPLRIGPRSSARVTSSSLRSGVRPGRSRRWRRSSVASGPTCAGTPR